MSEKITFKELVELIAEQSKQSQNSANSFVHELVKIIETGLKKSGSVSISGFGKFELRWMNERPGVHPQTGEEITIPGQNKVVFKPYKALREEVNKPFANLKSRLVREHLPDAEDPFAETDDKPEREDKTEVKPLIPPLSQTKRDENLPSIDELLIERDNPHYKEPEGPVATRQKEEAPVPAMMPAAQATVAKEVQDKGSFKWTYAAAVIIALVAFIVLFYMMQRTSGPATTTPEVADGQTEQLLTPVVPAIEPEDEETAAEMEPGVIPDPDAPPAEAATAEEAEAAAQPEPEITDGDEAVAITADAQTEFSTESLTVQPGQSLWSIAENELGNPYLWPLLYHLNRDQMPTPNDLPAESDIEIPEISDPENLNSFEREQVAMGYFTLYEWNTQHNPDEARYFLWAVGVFSPDMLETPPAEVDPDDLAFARNR